MKNVNLNGWAIGDEMYNWIRLNINEKSTILELGSGKGTIELCKNYVVYSIEHDEKWLNVATESNYIYAPIVNNWYDVKVLENKLPLKYDLIIVDGPTGMIGRKGFFDNIKLFNTSVPIIFDDVERKAEMELLVNVSKLLNRNYTIYIDDNKKFAVL